MKRAFAIALVLAFGMALVAGCGRQSTQEAERPEDRPDEETAKKPDEPAISPQPSMPEGEDPSLTPEEEARKPGEMERKDETSRERAKQGESDMPKDGKRDGKGAEQRGESKDMTPEEMEKKGGEWDKKKDDAAKQDTGKGAQKTAKDDEAMPKGMTREDSKIDDEFEEKIDADNQLKEYKVKSDTVNGVLTITGTVPRQDLAKKAEDLARTVAGIKQVRNDIQVTGEETKEPKKLSDRQMKNELEDKFDADSQLKDLDLDVEVKDGKATVSGIVPTDQTKRKIDMLARTVSGLTAVDNKATVQGARTGADKKVMEDEDMKAPEGRPEEKPQKERSDSGMGVELKTKFFADSQLSGWDVNIDVKNGVITMTGTVPNEQHKRKADMLAKTIAGQRGINNELQVTDEQVEEEKRSDRAIGAETKAKLFADSELSGWRINVDTQDGIVMMQGEVESEMLKRKATALAQTVAGVREVKNQITVKEKSERTAHDGEHSEMSKKLEKKFSTEPKMRGSDIHVEEKEGIVVLFGTVRSDEQKQMAERMASDLEGVREVKNNLQVKPEMK